MTKSIFTALDPAGAVHKRTSENRTYTHCVAVQASYVFDLAQAASKANAAHDAKTFAFYVEELDPATRKYGYDLELKQAEIAGFADAVAYSAKKQAERVAYVEAKKFNAYYEAWSVVGWCGRADLAQKLASQQSGPRYAAAVILEARKA